MIGKWWKAFLENVEPVSLFEIAEAARGKLSGEIPSGKIVATGVAIDTRRIQKGDLFVAFPGEKTDGHLFVKEAFNKGASACLVEKNAGGNPGGPLVRVKDTRTALMDLGRWYRNKIQAPVVAVTGSSGKSTAKEILAHLLSARFRVLKAHESYNNEIGVPLTLLSWASGDEVGVLEMAMRGKGEIRRLCAIARPTIGLVTSVGEAHIELLGSLEAIADAKGELVEAIPSGGKVFLNGEDAWGNYLAKKAAAAVFFYGFRPEFPVRAEEIKPVWEGTEFTLITPQGRARSRLSLLGRHNLLNFLGAVSIALSLGVPLEKIAAEASTCRGLHGRLEYKLYHGIKILDDSYNANPASLKAAMQTLSDLPVNGRRVLVLGDMLELGSFSEKAHRHAGKQTRGLRVDALFALGDSSKAAVEEAEASGLGYAAHFQDHESLAKALDRFLKKEDAVLVKGSRKMEMEKILGMVWA